MRFAFDGDTVSFPAVRLGPRWNGWQRPTVTGEVREKVAIRADEMELESPNDTDGPTLAEEIRSVQPNEDGTFSLHLGLTFTLSECYHCGEWVENPMQLCAACEKKRSAD